MEDNNDPEYTPYLDQFDRDIVHASRILEIINAALAMRASPNCIQRRLKQLNQKIPDYLMKPHIEITSFKTEISSRTREVQQ